MRYRVLAFLVVVTAGILLYGRLATPLHAPGGPDSAAGPAVLPDTIRAIEAGRQTAPLVGEQPRRGLPLVTFLAKADGPDSKDPPRIVSDVTGWGDRPDGNFDYTVGRMTRIGQTEWYSLQTTVEPYALDEEAAPKAGTVLASDW